VGINHNGDLEIAKKLVDAAVWAGAQAVKFQKRTPELCTPKEYWDLPRETPWGVMPYIEYRHRLELTEGDCRALFDYCGEKGIHFLASAWDEPSLTFLDGLGVPAFKIPSALAAIREFVRAHTNRGVPVIASTGGMFMLDVSNLCRWLDGTDYALLQCTMAYPADNDTLNLRVMQTYRRQFSVPVGYSGHERGIATSVAAVALGADILERHITLDRTMWGSDQAASLEPYGFYRLVRDVRAVEDALGSAYKTVLDCEQKSIEKLRYYDGR